MRCVLRKWGEYHKQPLQTWRCVRDLRSESFTHQKHVCALQAVAVLSDNLRDQNRWENVQNRRNLRE